MVSGRHKKCQNMSKHVQPIGTAAKYFVEPSFTFNLPVINSQFNNNYVTKDFKAEDKE